MARPLTVVLPSGKRAAIRAHRGRTVTTRDEDPSIVAGLLAAIRDGALEVEIAGTKLTLAGLDALDMGDVHVLRDVAIRARLVASEREELTCENCGHPLPFDPAALPLDDLSERYLAEAPRPKESVFPLSSPLPLRIGGEATKVRVATRTLREARPFLAALDEERFRVTPRFLAGMGVVALESDDGRHKIVKPVSLARALVAAPDAIWADVEWAYLSHVYPRAAVAPLVCASCGVLDEIEVPWPRELEGFFREGASRPFPSPEDFETTVEHLALPLFSAPSAKGVSLRVEVGPAGTDSGGAPMLGSYEPAEVADEAGIVRFQPEIVLYYRTFASMWADGEYDVEAEVRETLEHELEHHAYHLQGHDPMDEAERAEAQAELERVVGGKRAYRRQIAQEIGIGAWRVARVLVPLVVITGLLAYVVLAWLLNSL